MARFLFRHGMLQRLYTDFALGGSDRLRFLASLPLPRGIQAKLQRRIIDDLPGEYIASGHGLKLPGMLSGADPRGFRAKDLEATDIFYSQYFVGVEEISRRAPSKLIISDVFIVPNWHRVVQEQILAFPDWGDTPLSKAAIAAYDHQVSDMISKSSVLFCPSKRVQAEVEQIPSSKGKKCMLVPYGASISVRGETASEPGRVLFCGTLNLRKGVQYIRQAAALLERSHPRIKFIMAGYVTPTVREKLNAPNIEVCGHLSKSDMIQELGRSDVFLFPSLAEGAAGALLEAFASGIPVVATAAAGVDFTDGESGIMIPERDPEAIAAAIVKIYEDRNLRAHMSASARREAEAYSIDVWEQRFIDAIRHAAG